MTTKLLQEETSKSNKKCRTSSSTNQNLSHPFDDMFEDTNDSFEIPETQAFPPTDHMSDEQDSEGFIAMPNEEIETNDCSQSQAVLEGVELETRSPMPPRFDDSDTTDLEMSNLQWDDSTKNNDKNDDDTKSASVTPDLEFEGLSSAVTKEIEESLISPKHLNPLQSLVRIEVRFLFIKQ